MPIVIKKTHHTFIHTAVTKLTDYLHHWDRKIHHYPLLHNCGGTVMFSLHHHHLTHLSIFLTLQHLAFNMYCLFLFFFTSERKARVWWKQHTDREDFPRTGSESKVRINRYTKFFAICAEAEAVEAEGKECHQQANDVTAGTTTKLWMAANIHHCSTLKDPTLTVLQ